MERHEHANIPRWNGEPAGFKRWSQEVKIYRLRKEMNKEISYAADLIVGLSGAARSAALQLSEEDLWPQHTLMRAAQEDADLADDLDDKGTRPSAHWVTNKEVNTWPLIPW